MTNAQKGNRMDATLTVERIDILEGPNLKGLLFAFEHAAIRPDGFSGEVNLRFDNVVYLDDAHKEIDELSGRIFNPKLVGICYLGYNPSSETRDDFVITVSIINITFEGHYNAHTRKGSLRAVK